MATEPNNRCQADERVRFPRGHGLETNPPAQKHVVPIDIILGLMALGVALVHLAGWVISGVWPYLLSAAACLIMLPAAVFALAIAGYAQWERSSIAKRVVRCVLFVALIAIPVVHFTLLDVTRLTLLGAKIRTLRATDLDRLQDWAIEVLEEARKRADARNPSIGTEYADLSGKELPEHIRCLRPVFVRVLWNKAWNNSYVYVALEGGVGLMVGSREFQIPATRWREGVYLECNPK